MTFENGTFYRIESIKIVMNLNLVDRIKTSRRENMPKYMLVVNR